MQALLEKPSVSAHESSTTRWLLPRAAYIHIPFCAHKCWYCDFAVVAGQDQLADRYLDALEKEIGSTVPIANRTADLIETLFIGGGTPTHLQPKQLERLLKLTNTHFLQIQSGGRKPPVSDTVNLPPQLQIEFSVEANPGTLDDNRIHILADHGVNRLSLGAQSFQSHLLQFLERDHSSHNIAHAVERARTRIPEISLDLIFGVPGQTLEHWQADLQQAIDLGINHISTYGLTFEKGTRLWKERQAGHVQPLHEELERSMYASAMDMLEAAGFEHYEISNFARPGHRCRHNETYWANEAYFGFGVGAARYIRGRREINTRDTQSYIRKVLAGESPVQGAEELNPNEHARETAVVQLRRSDGIDRARYHHQTGFNLDSLLGEPIRSLSNQGFLNDDGERVSLTREGKFLADWVCSQLLSTSEPEA